MAALAFASLIVLLSWSLRRQNDAARTHARLAADVEKLRRAREEASSASWKTGEERDRYRRFFENTQEMILAYNVLGDEGPGLFCEANPVACERLGFDHYTILTLSPLDIEMLSLPEMQSTTAEVDRMTIVNAEQVGRSNPMAARQLQALIRRIIREKDVTYNGQYMSRQNKVIPVEVRARCITVGDSRIIFCSAVEIADRQQQDAESRERERLLRDIMAHSPAAIVCFDAQKEITFVTSSSLKMFGCPDRREFSNIKLLDSTWLPPKVCESVRRGQNAQCEVTADFDSAVKRGWFVTTRRGTAYFDTSIYHRGVDNSYNSRGWLVVIQDMTQIRELGLLLRQRDHQLIQAQKLEAIGTLAGGIAHDFNNILTPIMGYTELSLDSVKPEDPLHEYLSQVLASSKRARQLVEQILTFSRQMEAPAGPIRLTPIVKEVAKQLAANVASKNIRVDVVIKAEHDIATATPTQIHQILMNLCTNAAYAMKDGGGVVEIRLTNFSMSLRHRSEFPQLATIDYLQGAEKARYLRLSIRDTGTGVPKELQKKIFEPFFTTKPKGEGTGMGLAVVQGVVNSIGGAISIESEPGKGTTFHVVFPVIEETAQAVDISDQPLPKGNERILFVDDEVPIVRMASHLLPSLGYEAVVTHESPKALEMFRQNPSRFDLVITDMVMPQMTGAELAAELLKIRPDIPIIVCTGFSEKVTAADAQALSIRGFLIKPVQRRDLALAIRQALGNAPPDANTPADTTPKVPEESVAPTA